MNDVADVLAHPQVVSRDRLIETGLPGGQHADLLRMPFNIEGLDEAPSRVPEIGQHTDAVLSELGYAAAEIAALRQAGAV
jgi:itaconate CoA-transferase